MTLPEIYAKTANAPPMIADVPVANPSIPSVILAPLDTAVIMMMTIGIKMIQAIDHGFSKKPNKVE